MVVYVPITYVPDGPVTSALKKGVRGRRPKPELGNLGPMLDDNLSAARKHGHFRYHPDDLRLLKGVSDNPEIVDEGFAVLREVMEDKGIDVPSTYQRERPYYPDVPSILRFTALLALLMTLGITIAVLLGQNDSVLWMTVAIVLISLAGTGAFAWILHRCVVHVGAVNDPAS